MKKTIIWIIPRTVLLLTVTLLACSNVSQPDVIQRKDSTSIALAVKSDECTEGLLGMCLDEFHDSIIFNKKNIKSAAGYSVGIINGRIDSVWAKDNELGFIGFRLPKGNKIKELETSKKIIDTGYGTHGEVGYHWVYRIINGQIYFLFYGPYGYDVKKKRQADDILDIIIRMN